MSAIQCWVTGLVLGCSVSVCFADPPTCTTHFFDWYTVSEKRPLSDWQKRWTYQVDWGVFGITPEEIGNSVHCYEAQCRKIREAGFDGIHYEWHNNNPKPQFIEAIQKTGVPVAMFYDMQIRFSKRPNFITPTEEFAKEAVNDVLSFYNSVPKSLWLYDRNGNLPIVVYGYAFDRTVTDPERWDKFYRSLIGGVEKGLGERVVFHWTNNGSPQQMYGFQHFPQIQSYIFNEAGGETQVNAHSVTFVVHYDDLGVSFVRKGPRAARWIRNDIRYLQEALWLARHSNPDLVFHYGWNELYEGEHIFPDTLWGTWRYEAASAMVKDIKAHAKADLPRALIVADDFLPALHGASREKTAILKREMSLLTQLRAFVPQAEVVLPGSGRNPADYEIVFSLNTVKNTEEETALAACGRRIVYANPDERSDTPMTRLFTSEPRGPLPRPDLGPANEFVVASRKVDVDLGRFPILHYRCCNSVGTTFHIRYYGLDPKGQEVAAWYEDSPTDDRQTHGKWVEGEANVAAIATRGAKGPISRLTGIEIILDDLQENGEFTLDVDYLRMSDKAGAIGWQDEFESAADWSVNSSFENAPNGRERFAFAAVKDDGATIGRMTLKAVVSDKLEGPVDESTRGIAPLEGVRVLAHADVHGVKVPIVLAHGKCYWLNTYSPSEECWAKLVPELMDLKLNDGVMFHSYSFSVREDGLTSLTHHGPMVIQEEELPMDRIRLVAPPELDQALPVTLPINFRGLSLRVVQGKRQTIPFPDPGSTPPSITLEPGEVVDLMRQK